MCGRLNFRRVCSQAEVVLIYWVLNWSNFILEVLNRHATSFSRFMFLKHQFYSKSLMIYWSVTGRSDSSGDVAGLKFEGRARAESSSHI